MYILLIAFRAFSLMSDPTISLLGCFMSLSEPPNSLVLYIIELTALQLNLEFIEIGWDIKYAMPS